MNDPVPHLAIVHVDTIPREFLGEFASSVRSDGLVLKVQARPATPFAGIEWLMPSAIAAYLAKPYFESFLKEMGKDHYALLKDGLKKLYKRVAGPDAPEVTIVSTAGKASQEQPYSHFFSVLLQGPNGELFKLLIPRPITKQEYEMAIGAFLDFGESLYAQTLDANAAEVLKARPAAGRTVLLAYDVSEQRLKSIDPMADRR